MQLARGSVHSTYFRLESFARIFPFGILATKAVPSKISLKNLSLAICRCGLFASDSSVRGFRLWVSVRNFRLMNLRSRRCAEFLGLGGTSWLIGLRNHYDIEKEPVDTWLNLVGKYMCFAIRTTNAAKQTQIPICNTYKRKRWWSNL